MLDYKLLTALAAVVECGGFERAARMLGLSQSAVSQRIKLLEVRAGAPVLQRASPPRPTSVGQRLLNHVQQVRLLERDLHEDLPIAGPGDPPARLRIALNADSLATWWSTAVAGLCERENLLLDLLVDDQDVGLRRMRAGEVAGCLCATADPVAGARSVLLGHMRYLAVACPAFIRRHLPEGLNAGSVASAPAIVFGQDDQLQHRFVSGQGLVGEFPYHLCPSSEGFVRMLVSGLGWGMVPALQIRQELEDGVLVELAAGEGVEVPLYWHYWRHGGRLLDSFTNQLVREAPRWLETICPS
ncbi:LysR family transcriptional regulator ArgP [Pseudomonas sp. gcc21]|uniref:LysR family transcriptional regulator ArgP n=1 Tax=Pseudomonas sp. gcc21 TaxID=2726989 RepID=UPI0014523A8E|nr:LysR family transcriptional regulator ArgP [Pseudomonas sp. gcc21]QJD58787.1 LysR family transcriptional regulator ArgP [Pseudomonas sp. gcc21]